MDCSIGPVAVAYDPAFAETDPQTNKIGELDRRIASIAAYWKKAMVFTLIVAVGATLGMTALANREGGGYMYLMPIFMAALSICAIGGQYNVRQQRLAPLLEERSQLVLEAELARIDNTARQLEDILVV